MGAYKKLREAMAGGVTLLSAMQFIQRLPYKFTDRNYFLSLREMQIQQRCGRIIHNLRKKYKKSIAEWKERAEREDDGQVGGENIIWTMWLQGMDNAPDIVKMCHKSVVDGFSDRYKIVVLDENNISDYVTLPDYIEEKYKRGIISKQWYSDLVRLELLEKYGGTWMDATIFYAGGEVPSYMMGDGLFIYQTLFPATLGIAAVMNNFFISAHRNDKLLKLTKLLLYEYWRRNDYCCDYWIMYDFFEIARAEFPAEWEKVVPVDHTKIHILQSRFFKPFDEKVYRAAIDGSPFHKLSWKAEEDELAMQGTLCRYLLDKYL